MHWNLLEAAKVLVAYTTCLCVTLGWVHFSRQTKVPRSNKNCLLIATRIAIMLAAVSLISVVVLGVTVNYLLVLLAIVLFLSPLASFDDDSAMNVSFGGSAVGMALSWSLLLPVFILKQVVLGFPERDHVVLEPPQEARSSVNRSAATLVRSHQLAVDTSARAMVVATLRPMGTIEYDGKRVAAKSIDGKLIEVGQKVQICGRHNGSYQVCVQDEKQAL